MVPVGGDVFEGEAELFVLSGGERRDVQVDCISVGTRGLKDVQWDIFGLHDLAKRIFEAYADDGVIDGFVAGIGDGAVKISNRGADEILCRTHLQVGEFEIGGVGVGRVGNLGICTEEESSDAYHHEDQAQAEQDRNQV